MQQMRSLQGGKVVSTTRRAAGLLKPYLAARRVGLNVIAKASSVPVTISIQKQVDMGEQIMVVGNQSFIGNWEAGKAQVLKWTDGDNWTGTFQAPVGKEVCFKLVQGAAGSNVAWEGGDDRKFTALGPDYGLKINCVWDETGNTQVDAYRLEGGSSSNGASRSSSSSRNGSRSGSMSDSDSSPPPKQGVSLVSLSSIEEDARSTSSWVGSAPQFVRSRQDKTERRSVWNTQGLDGPELELVQGDQKAANWLKKLELLKVLLVDRPNMMRPQLKELAACYVYATWINSGAIECVESGSHHRPNHHANNSLQMFRSLEWAIHDSSTGEHHGGGERAEARVLAARRMHTRLPSISGEFRVSTPLTRIRDIAHRNDIPQDLKNEIKHTLQNKLHRSAGPEDLVATEAMLARVTKNPGEYNDAFVREFCTFAKELREFFNASGLVELLDQTSSSIADDHRAVVTQFKAAMAQLDNHGGGDPPLDDLMNALFMGTQARCYYAAGLAAGLRNDVGDDVLAMRQRWRLAEIRIEDYVFVLMARIIGQLEAAGGAGMLSRANSGGAWKVATSALTNGLRHLGLSQFATKELLALENELEAWLGSAGGPVEKRESALRGKSSAERVVRLASQYSDIVMDVYANPAARLGTGLGVPEHMARIFGESEVRASVAFQVSRLAAMLVKALRGAANMEAWDGLVTGEAYGRLVEVDGISPEIMEAACAGHDDSVVLLARRADGDEEVGALGPRLAGVVLLQELPHLSHLGVRARQEKCTFATCDDDEYYRSRIQPLVGSHVCLSVTSDAVTLTQVQGRSPSHSSSKPSHTADPTHANGNGASNGKGGVAAAPGATRSAKVGSDSIAATEKTSSLVLVPLAEAEVNTCGSKAAKCGALERLAHGAGRMFSTPAGASLPFGSMELSLKEGGLMEEYQTLLKQLEKPDLSGAALEGECDRMSALLSKLQLPSSLLDQISKTFGSDKLLAVRSSANVEDLAGMSAAGLYDSKVGVPVSDLKAVTAAVSAVWASLYSRRAVLSRRAAGVLQSSACMSVLIMELVAPDVCFVLHTARPRDSNHNIVLAELAPGQGETLASGTRGTPWRLEVDKTSQKVDTLAFANFSRALVVPLAIPAGMASKELMVGGRRYKSFDEQHDDVGGGTAVAARPIAQSSHGGLVEVEVDYSTQLLSTDPKYRDQVGQQLAKIGVAIEQAFGGEAQDIEGGLLCPASGGAPQYVVFQTRPQL